MRFLGNFNPHAMPLPGDVAYKDSAFQRYELGGGWQTLDTFRGEYDPEATYEPADVVIRGGAVWMFTPDQGPDVWTCLAGNGEGAA